MAKKLIIKGANFSANGMLPVLDATNLLARLFVPRQSLNNYAGQGGSNAKRCCISAFSWASMGIDILRYKKLEVTVKSGFDYVFGTGPKPGTLTGWTGWDGATKQSSFVWTTGNQKGIATLDSTMLSMSLNLRYDDNTTEFSSSTVLTDIVESIKLIP